MYNSKIKAILKEVESLKIDNMREEVSMVDIKTVIALSYSLVPYLKGLSMKVKSEGELKFVLSNYPIKLRDKVLSLIGEFSDDEKMKIEKEFNKLINMRAMRLKGPFKIDVMNAADALNITLCALLKEESRYSDILIKDNKFMYLTIITELKVVLESLDRFIVVNYSGNSKH